MMYAVYRYHGDDRQEYHNLLFVTSSKRTADQFVDKANYEFSEAKKVPVPSWTQEDIVKFGPNYHMVLIEEYNEKLFSIQTTDPTRWPIEPTQKYYYEQVEER